LILEIAEFLNTDMTEGEKSSQQFNVRSVVDVDATGVKPDYVQHEYNDDDALFTHVFNDIFHVQSHLLKLLPKAHSAFNSFA